MVETLLVAGIISLLIALVVSFAMLRSQQRTLASMQARQQAWERAQEARQQQWREQQERRILDLEKNINTKIQQVRAEWQHSKEDDSAQTEELQRQFADAVAQIRMEHELARLPRIEDTPLPPNGKGQNSRSGTQPLTLQGADLSRRDFSSRSLENADLRDAQLVQSNLFMADLSHARLARANLAGANLSAANLSHADLQGANLKGASLLVTDLHDTILVGANLLQVRNLTPEQLRTAVYDHATQLDPEIARALSYDQPLASQSQDAGELEDIPSDQAAAEEAEGNPTDKEKQEAIITPATSTDEEMVNTSPSSLSEAQESGEKQGASQEKE